MFTLYVIMSETTGKIYIGQTINIQERLKQHNSDDSGHLGKFTYQNKGPWKLVYQEQYLNRTDAIKRERQLKSYRGRQSIKNIIKDIRP